MAYFDSPKNRAMWERKMAGLREEKQRRKENGYTPEKKEQKRADEAENPFRKKIGLERLEQMERESSGIRRVKRPVRNRAVQQEKELSPPEKNGKTL